MMKRQEYTIDFLKSALTLENPQMPTEDFLEWMKNQREAVKVRITPIKFSEMQQWHFDQNTNLVHASGKFFSIEGIDIQTNWGDVTEWSQPIINQPEIGFLGIITKKFNGVLHFLMQAKIEPGNINFVQLSPTLQATKSNYTKVHKGKTPLYLEYFMAAHERKEDKKVTVLLDQLQSEQGARFLRKRNRNIIIEVDENEELEIHDHFCWLTLGQIKHFLTHDNIINMDTRTVISGIPFGNYRQEVTQFYETLQSIHTFSGHYPTALLSSAIENDRHLHSIEHIISWITNLKSLYELEVRQIPLDSVKYWQRDDYAIFHEAQKYFSVIAVRAEIGNREVQSWTQPLFKAAQEGIIGFIIKKINGIYHFLVQAKLEAGNLDIIELAPTVQCLTGNYRKGYNEYEPPFLDYVLNAKAEQVRYNTYQSEEGGRFFKEQNQNLIIEAADDFLIEDLPENYIWMTLNQIHTFIKFNNYLNIQARSLLAAVSFV